MLDIKLIREDPERVKESVRRRDRNIDVDKILKLDEQRRSLLSKIQNFQTEINKISSKGKKPNQEQIEKAKEIKSNLSVLKLKIGQTEQELNKLLSGLPNLLHPDVPDGKDENDNKEIRKWGKPKKFRFQPQDHLALGEKLDLIDTKTSAEVSGTRFNYLKNEAVFIQFALVQLVLQTLTDKKIISKIAKSVGNPDNNVFQPIVPPVMVREEIMEKMGRLEPKEERYILPKDKLVLVGSAEHTLGPLHMEQILEKESLPIRYIGYSTSFRREAGSYGKDTRGILRVHQFDKLEMETFCCPENSVKEQDFLVAIQEHLMQQLEIPYRVMMVCAGDMGDPDYRQIDIEAWLPGQNKYRETHTSDLMTDYQSRRLNTRYRENSCFKYVHMNDATAFAIGRTLIAILENHQEKDGSVKMPKALHKYLGFKEIPKK